MAGCFSSRLFPLLLSPESEDDFVATDNPVHIVDAFVDGLDQAAARFERVRPKATGRPGDEPANLLKLYLYDRAHPPMFMANSGI